LPDRPRHPGHESRPLLVALRALGLGDLLTAAPALRALADAHPEHRRVLACPEALAPLVRLIGAVDGVINIGPLEPLPPTVHGADIAVNLHGKGPQSTALLAGTRPRRLLAFEHPAVPSTAGGPRWEHGEHEVYRWCRLLAEHGVPADPARLDVDAPAVDVPSVALGATVLHAGAASPARRWPAARWIEVARAERASGRRIVVTGSAGERSLAVQIARGAGLSEGSVLAGRTSVLELAALVAAAGRVVCGDTGVAHLATALRTPSVVLFGPVPPSAWGPPPRPEHRALWAGSVGDPHGRRADAGLLAISVDDVLGALERIERLVAA
jgi:ADP-heptose:LPS heptosyltransferase